MSDEKALIQVHPEGEQKIEGIQPAETGISLDTFAAMESIPSCWE
jgi:hypothetical protein